MPYVLISVVIQQKKVNFQPGGFFLDEDLGPSCDCKDDTSTLYTMFRRLLRVKSHIKENMKCENHLSLLCRSYVVELSLYGRVLNEPIDKPASIPTYIPMV